MNSRFIHALFLALSVLPVSAFALDSSSISPLNVTAVDPTATAQSPSQASSTTIDVCRAIYDGAEIQGPLFFFKINGSHVYQGGVTIGWLTYDAPRNTCRLIIDPPNTWGAAIYLKLSHDGATGSWWQGGNSPFYLIGFNSWLR